ncbi:hypothetical protein BH10CHL1_BH10CHL1_05740 [soil metagenome]
MNFGIVTTWFERGAAYVSRQYLQALQVNHPVAIYARGGEAYARHDPAWDQQGITWDPRKSVGPATALDLKHFKRWLEREKIDCVLFNEQHWWPPVWLCHDLGIKTAAYVDYYTENTVPLFGCYDVLLCNTRRHHSVFDWHPQSIYLPWGAPLDLFAPQSSAPVQPDKVTFFHSAGMNPQRKGTNFVLESFAELADSATRLVLHSQSDLKAAFPELGATIDRLRGQGVLDLYEQTISAPGLYHLGDVYVYPSTLDGLGLTLIEALASGLPVITTDHPPMNEFVDVNRNGRLVDVARLVARFDGYYWPQSYIKPASLTEQMRFYLDNRANLSTFKSQARQYAEENLDWHKNAAHLADDLIQAKREPEPALYRKARQKAEAFERQRRTLVQKYPRLAGLLLPMYQRLVKR